MMNENNGSPKLSVEVIMGHKFEVLALVDTGATILLINKRIKEEIERKVRELDNNNDRNEEIFPRMKTREVDLVNIFGTRGKVESHTILRL